MKIKPSEIRRLRYDRDWTQADLAQRIGVSRICVALWETGVHYPGVKNRRVLRRLLADKNGR